MLAANTYPNTYPKTYIEACRAGVQAQLSAYQRLRNASRAKAGTSDSEFRSAEAAFEEQFFNGLILVLEQCFVHRTRGLEGKDGNALNEVRMLANSILTNAGIMSADKTIKYDPARSALGIAVGERIKASPEQFEALCRAYFAAIEAKFA
jgi:capsid protein